MIDFNYLMWKKQVVDLVNNLELTDMVDYALPDSQLLGWYDIGYTPEQVGYVIQQEGI